MDIFRASEAELNKFLGQNLEQYSRLRNFDFGPDKRDNVSQLSKYISHRVLDEYDLVRATLGVSTYERAEKFKVGQNCIHKALKMLGVSYKKSLQTPRGKRRKAYIISK